MKLAIAQMVLGLIISWGQVFTVGVEVFLFPIGLSFFILGLAVLGCGVAQFLKAREVRIKHEATP